MTAEKESKASRYPWAEAPEWAEYAATDRDGEAVWYERQPRLNQKIGWWHVSYGGRQQSVSSEWPVPGVEDYKTSLEARP